MTWDLGPGPSAPSLPPSAPQREDISETPVPHLPSQLQGPQPYSNHLPSCPGSGLIPLIRCHTNPEQTQLTFPSLGFAFFFSILP